MPLNVAYYSDAMTTGGRYGLGRYAWELFRELGKLDAQIAVRPVSAHASISPAEVAAMRDKHGYVPLPWGRRATASLWSAFGAPAVERWAPWAEVVHSVELDYRVATRKPLVVTIHDIGPLTHPHYFTAAHPWLLRTALRSAVRRAAAIICVSQATADAVREYVKCDVADRMVIIPEGVSEEFFALDEVGSAATHPATGAPYFLWTGSINPRKNVDRVVRAFEEIAARLPHHLVLCGGSGWDASESVRRARRSPVAKRIHLPGRVSDERLRELYRGATAFVFASLLEGFGLPILEAMASGCPVITSNISSMPEVAGGAALLVDPLNVAELANAMERIASDAPLARELVVGGRARAAQFRWRDCAARVANVYVAIKRGQTTTLC